MTAFSGVRRQPMTQQYHFRGTHTGLWRDVSEGVHYSSPGGRRDLEAIQVSVTRE